MTINDYKCKIMQICKYQNCKRGHKKYVIARNSASFLALPKIWKHLEVKQSGSLDVPQIYGASKCAERIQRERLTASSKHKHVDKSEPTIPCGRGKATGIINGVMMGQNSGKDCHFS